MWTARGIRLTCSVVSALAVLVLPACASAPVIPLRGSAADWAALAGRWDGTYSGRDSSRAGSVSFELTAGDDHAHGDVLMAASDGDFYTPLPPGVRSPAQPPERVRFIPIRFVRADGSAITGQLESYWAPECGCDAETTFSGELRGSRLSGTFVTRYSTGALARGRWEATRRR
jgi:hypothetical protein